MIVQPSPVAGFAERRRMILLLPGEKGGMREISIAVDKPESRE
jgi:hypothetical protein